MKSFFKFVFKAVYSYQAYCDFLDPCSIFSVVHKIRFGNKSFEFLGIEKEYEKNLFMGYFRFGHTPFFGPHCIFFIYNR